MPKTIGRPSHQIDLNPFHHDAGEYLILPENDHNITPGYYAHSDLGRLLRGLLKADAKSINPKTIRRRLSFLADMLD